MWGQLQQTYARFKAEAEKRWLPSLVFIAVSIVFQSRLAEAADWVIGLVNASGLSADAVRGLVGPLGVIAIVVVIMATHAYLETWRSSRFARDSRPRAKVTAPAAMIEVTFRVGNAETLERLMDATEALRPSAPARRSAPDHLLPFDERMRRIGDWATGRVQLMQEGEEIARVIRGLALRADDDGLRKDLVTSIADRRARAWIGDADEFEDHWFGGQLLTTGYLGRVAAGLTYHAAPAPKPSWRQKRVRDIEMRLDRLRTRAAPSDPTPFANDTPRGEEG